MANLKTFKKDVDYLTEQVLADSYMTICFQPEKKDQVLAIMQKALDVRNDLFKMANNPPEKNNRSLIKKHYNHIRREMFVKIDDLFVELSALSK